MTDAQGALNGTLARALLLRFDPRTSTNLLLVLLLQDPVHLQAEGDPVPWLVGIRSPAVFFPLSEQTNTRRAASTSSRRRISVSSCAG